MDLATYQKAQGFRESIEYLNERIRWFMPFFEKKDKVKEIVIHCEKSDEICLSLTTNEFYKVLEAIDKNLHDQVNELEKKFAAITEVVPKLSPVIHFGEDFVLDLTDREVFINICRASKFDNGNCEMNYKCKEESPTNGELYDFDELVNIVNNPDLQYFTLNYLQGGKATQRIPFITLNIEEIGPFSAGCLRCGDTLSHNGVSEFKNQAAFDEAIEAEGWSCVDEERSVCPNCSQSYFIGNP